MGTSADATVRIVATFKDAGVKSGAAGVNKEIGGIGAAAGKLKAALAGLGLGLAFRAAWGEIKQTAAEMDAVAKASQRVGISVETLSALGYAAQQSGSNLGELESALKLLSRTMDAANRGTAEAKEYFDKAGISITDANGKLRALDAVLLDAADKFAAMSDGSEKTALAMGLFGRSGAQLIPLLNEGKDGIKALTDEADRLGITLSGDAARSATLFGDQLDRLNSQIEGLKRRFVAATFNDFSAFFEASSGYAAELSKSIYESDNATGQFGETGLRVFGYVSKGILGIKEAWNSLRAGIGLLSDVAALEMSAIADVAEMTAMGWEKAWLTIKVEFRKGASEIRDLVESLAKALWNVGQYYISIGQTKLADFFSNAGVGAKMLGTEIGQYLRDSSTDYYDAIGRLNEINERREHVFDDTKKSWADLKKSFEDFMAAPSWADRVAAGLELVERAIFNAREAMAQFNKEAKDNAPPESSGPTTPITFPGGPEVAGLSQDEQQQLASERAAEFEAAIKRAAESLQFLESPVNSLQGSLSTFFKEGITGAKSFGDAMKELGRSFVNILAEMIAQMLAALAIKALLFGVGALIGGPAGVAVAGLGSAVAIPGSTFKDPTTVIGGGQRSASSSSLSLPPQQRASVQNINVVNVSAVDSQSFIDAMNRNAQGLAPAIRTAFETSPSLQTGTGV